MTTTLKEIYEAAKVLDDNLVKVTRDDRHGLMFHYSNPVETYSKPMLSVAVSCAETEYPLPEPTWRDADPKTDRWGMKARFRDDSHDDDDWYYGVLIGHDPRDGEWISETFSSWDACQVLIEETK